VARKHSGDILIWVLKILLGIIYAERLLPWQRSKPGGRRILPREMKDSLSMTHFFVQGLDLKIEFEAEGKVRIPGSVFIFNLKQLPDPAEHFTFRDDLNSLSVYMRLGNRGIVATADGGALDIDVGDMRSTIRALIVANDYLETEVSELMKAVSHAYVRGRFRTYSG